MKKLLISLLAVFVLSGCNSLERILKKEPSSAQVQQLPDDYTIEGVTVTDFQIIELPIKGRELLIDVKRPGEMKFVRLYKDSIASEYKITSGPPSDAVWFRRRVVISGGLYTFPSPVAPTGTQYRIRSIRTEQGSSDLY